MPFTLDEESLLIKGRRGDTASFTFDFNQDISNYTVHFYVQRNIGDTKALISKEYKNPTSQAITVELNSSETANLAAKINSYSIYYWGIKISLGNNFVQTIVPRDFENPPMIHVYPMLGEV